MASSLFPFQRLRAALALLFRPHGLFWRFKEAPKDYRYGGFRAALHWVVFGVAADEED